MNTLSKYTFGGYKMYNNVKGSEIILVESFEAILLESLFGHGV